MTCEGVLEVHGLVIPYFDGSIPRSRDYNWVFGILVEFNARDPVSVCVLFNSEFTLSNSVPNL